MRGEGRKASPDMGLRKNLIFLKCGVTTLKIKAGKPQEPSMNNPVVLLPSGLYLLGRTAHGSCKSVPWRCLAVAGWSNL